MTSAEFAERFALSQLDPLGELGLQIATVGAWVVNASGNYKKVITPEDMLLGQKASEDREQREVAAKLKAGLKQMSELSIQRKKAAAKKKVARKPDKKHGRKHRRT